MFVWDVLCESWVAHNVNNTYTRLFTAAIFDKRHGNQLKLTVFCEFREGLWDGDYRTISHWFSLYNSRWFETKKVAEKLVWWQVSARRINWNWKHCGSYTYFDFRSRLQDDLFYGLSHREQTTTGKKGVSGWKKKAEKVLERIESEITT